MIVVVALIFSCEYFFCNSGFSIICPFDVDVLLARIEVLLLLGRYLAELVPRDAESAFDLTPLIP